MDKVLAVVVTFNPKIPLLKKNLTALTNQVTATVVFDNHSDNIEEIRRLLSSFSHIHLVENQANLGLPVNYNRAVQIARRRQIPWLLTMDQDTIICPHMIDSYLRLRDEKDVAIISPLVRDINKKDDRQLEPPAHDAFTDVGWCLSSGSLNRVETLLALGGFDERLFIDWVDFDYCKKVRIHGYRVVRDNSSTVIHQLGDGPETEKHFFWKTFYCRPWPVSRLYYMMRNRVYYTRKYKHYPEPDLASSKNHIVLLKLLVIYCHQDSSIKRCASAIHGFIDGYRMPVDPVPPHNQQ